MKFVASFLALILISTSAFAQNFPGFEEDMRAQELSSLEREVVGLQEQIQHAKEDETSSERMMIAGVAVAVVSITVTAKFTKILKISDLPGLFFTGVGVGTAGLGGYTLKIDKDHLNDLDARLKVIRAKIEAKKIEIGKH